MTVDFIYLFRQIEFTHQCGHALVLSLFAGLLDAQEEMETWGGGGGGGGGESSSWSIPTCGVELAGCRAGWNIEPMDKPFLPKQSSQRVSLVFLYLFLMVCMYKCQISSVFCWDFVWMCVCVCVWIQIWKGTRLLWTWQGSTSQHTMHDRNKSSFHPQILFNCCLSLTSIWSHAGPQDKK